MVRETRDESSKFSMPERNLTNLLPHLVASPHTDGQDLMCLLRVFSARLSVMHVLEHSFVAKEGIFMFPFAECSQQRFAQKTRVVGPTKELRLARAVDDFLSILCSHE